MLSPFSFRLARDDGAYIIRQVGINACTGLCTAQVTLIEEEEEETAQPHPPVQVWRDAALKMFQSIEADIASRDEPGESQHFLMPHIYLEQLTRAVDGTLRVDGLKVELDLRYSPLSCKGERNWLFEFISLRLSEKPLIAQGLRIEKVQLIWRALNTTDFLVERCFKLVRGGCHASKTYIPSGDKGRLILFELYDPTKQWEPDPIDGEQLKLLSDPSGHTFDCVDIKGQLAQGTRVGWICPDDISPLEVIGGSYSRCTFPPNLQLRLSHKQAAWVYARYYHLVPLDPDQVGKRTSGHNCLLI